MKAVLKSHSALTLCIIFFLLSCWSPSPSFAQLSFGGVPKEKPQETFRSSDQKEPLEIAVPFSKEDLLAKAHWNNQLREVGRKLDVAIDFFAEADHFVATDGTHCYDLPLLVRDAVGLTVAFKQFQLPEGGRFYIYTPSSQLGAFTSASNPSGGFFSTAPIAGSRITLRYEAPATAPQATIELSHLGYLYRSVALARSQLGKEGSSLNCEVNVNCPEGDKVEKEKDATVLLLVKIGDSYSSCSGTVVNNTAEDFAPYILTAAHCGGTTSPLPASDYREWVFVFHYAKPACSNNYQLAKQYLSLTGCEMVSFVPTSGASDGLLLKLLSPIPQYYGVYYAGWDRREQLDQNHIGLHHPSGDVMKVSTSNIRPTIRSFDDGSHKGADNAYINVEYIATPNGHGVTEGGSSGSGLYNSKNLLVATLTGGNSSCRLTNGTNVYGRLSHHWDKYPTYGKKIALALDPIGQGVAKTLEGKYQSGSVKGKISPITELEVHHSVVNGQQKATFSWKLPQGEWSDNGWQLQIIKESDQGKEITTLPITQTQWEDIVKETTTGTQLYTFCYSYKPQGSSSAILFPPRRIALFTRKLAPIRDLVIKELGGGKKQLTWKKPINFQRVTNIDPNETNFEWLGAYKDPAAPIFGKLIQTLYTGMLYNGLELTPLIGKQIVAVELVTSRSDKVHTYSAFVRQGINKDPTQNYRMVADTPDKYVETPLATGYKQHEKHQILLQEPFVIRGDELLVVGVKTKTAVNFTSRSAVVAKKGIAGAIDNGVVSHYYQEAGKDPCSNRWYPFAEAFEGDTGYSATSFVVCDATGEEIREIPAAIPYGPYPALFPKLKGYRILQNGELVVEIDSPNQLVAEVNGEGVFEVIPIYEGYKDGASSQAEEVSSREENPMVYPTLFSEIITIETAEALVHARLYALDGKLLHQETILATSSRHAMDVDHLPSGGYLLQLTSPSGEVFIYQLYKQ